MSLNINELIAASLCAARVSIEKHGISGLQALIVHPKGVQCLLGRAAPSSQAEEEGLDYQINALVAELGGQMVILISDKWVAVNTPDNFVAYSSKGPFPGNQKAIVVEIYGFEGILKCGMQKYRHCPDGQVSFEEFVWGALPTDGNHSDGSADPSKEN